MESQKPHIVKKKKHSKIQTKKSFLAQDTITGDKLIIQVCTDECAQLLGVTPWTVVPVSILSRQEYCHGCHFLLQIYRCIDIF